MTKEDNIKKRQKYNILSARRITKLFSFTFLIFGFCGGCILIYDTIAPLLQGIKAQEVMDLWHKDNVIINYILGNSINMLIIGYILYLVSDAFQAILDIMQDNELIV